MLLLLISATYLLVKLSVPVAASCYYPDGSVALHVPCSESTDESTCCGTGYACLGLSASFFLCQATGDAAEKEGTTELVRGSCTDKSWKSSNCPNVCVDTKRDNTTGWNGVAACPDKDTDFYCLSTGLGVDNCSTGFDLIEFASEPTVLTTIGVTQSTTTSAAPETDSSTGPITSATPTSSELSVVILPSWPIATTTTSHLSIPKLHTSSISSAMIGVAVGVSIGGLSLIVTAVTVTWLIMRKRRSSSKTSSIAAAAQENNDSNSNDNSNAAPVLQEAYHKPELGGTEYTLHEAPTDRVIHEAPSNRPAELHELPATPQRIEHK